MRSAKPFPMPHPVQKGARLAVVAPSGPFDRERFEIGLGILRERYEVVFDEGLFSRTGYFAGSDERRLAELQEAIRNPEIDAIVCARGGYGATRLLPDLDPSEVAEANKLLVGFSDITALHALWARAGVRSIHGPMVASLTGASDRVREEWFATLEGRDSPETWEIESLVSGSAEGRLIGGNLAVLGALVGTPHAPPIDGCLLFLEDVGERPYRVDRVLTSLRQAGWLERCAGFILGAFTEGDPGPDGITLEAVLKDRLCDLGVPVVTSFPAGHIDDNEPLTFGATARIDGETVTIMA
ncbi:MAG: LD-carboxypeptidase [Verrucomicrobiae bacterium]|nr:LD-carboxypeptidase [Verrucomicrobiae bacterium]